MDGCGVGPTLAANFTEMPSQAVQNYRASSFSLLLDRYDNEQPANASDSDIVEAAIPPLPSDINATYFACLNDTLGQTLILPSGDAANSGVGYAGSQMQLSVFLLPTLLFSLLLGL